MPAQFSFRSARSVVSWAGVLAIALAASSAVAVDASLTPTADNSIYRDQPGSSNGAGTGLFVGNNANQITSTRRALLRFDLSAIPQNAFVTSASLGMFLEHAQTTVTPLRLHRVTAGWGEGTSVGGGGGGSGGPATAGDATWDARIFPGTSWTTAGGDFVAAASTTTLIGAADSSYTWPSSPSFVADVQQFLDQPAANFGWIVIGNETTTRTAKRFSSREADIVDDRPTLKISYLKPGDATGDDHVNFADLLILAQNFGQTGLGFTSANFDRVGSVDFSDLLILAQNFESSRWADVPSSIAADWQRALSMVPEPATLGTIFVFAIGGRRAVRRPR